MPGQGQGQGQDQAQAQAQAQARAQAQAQAQAQWSGFGFGFGFGLGLGLGLGLELVLRGVPAQPVDSRQLARQAGLYALHEAMVFPGDSLEFAPARAAVGADPERLG